MPKIEYVSKRFNARSLLQIERANEIITEYETAGFVLTLRQLYYQFVSREFVPNSQKSYKALGSVINDARLAGLIDWEAIEDRTRSLRKRSHWDSPAGVIESAAASYGMDLWQDQNQRVEVWIEKDALIGVIERPCTNWDVPYFSCRGYASQSEVWRAAQRHVGYDAPVLVIHLGDHDPSGIDMTRDIQERLHILGAEFTKIHRVALNMDQVRHFKLPPNPAKATDARFAQYQAEHGDESWELDALDPKMIEQLIEKTVLHFVDLPKWKACKAQQEKDRSLIQKTSDNWKGVVKFLGDAK